MIRFEWLKASLPILNHATVLFRMPFMVRKKTLRKEERKKVGHFYVANITLRLTEIL